MTDPTPQAVTCLHCSEAIEKGVGGLWYSARSGSACYENRGQGGHTPAEPSPAPQVHVRDDGECTKCWLPRNHEGPCEFGDYTNNLAASPAPQAPVPVPTTQGEIPERWKITYRQEGLSELARCIRQLGRAEWERDYWKQNAEYSARSGPHAETVVQLREDLDSIGVITAVREERDIIAGQANRLNDELNAMREARDRAQEALRDVLGRFTSTEILKAVTPDEAMAVRFCPMAETPKVADVLRWRDVLNPVSDRQPEGGSSAR